MELIDTGLLDLPAPLFAWLDGLLAGLPGAVRLVFWGALAGLLTMLLYRAVSPQAAIARTKQEQLELRRRLDAFDGELAEAWPLMRRLLRQSLGHVGRVIGPAVLASLPVLCVLVWASTAYGYRFPEQEPPALRITPQNVQARWLRDPGRTLELSVAEGHRTEVRVEAPVTVIERWHWWNLLIGNPAGYLTEEAPARRVELELPKQQHLAVGPPWMRGWEFPFFTALIAASLLLKRLMRIH